MEPQLFALGSSKHWGENVAEHLHIPLSLHEEREFEDGEHKIRPLENVRGRDVFVLNSLYSDTVMSVNDKLCRLLFFISALKDASAAKVSVVIPYFAYARKDRKTKPRDPITMKYMAKLLESAGADQIIALDIHNLSAFQNAFRIPTEHMEAKVLFAPYFTQMSNTEDIMVISPDAGGMKRAESFRETLSELCKKPIGIAFLEKHRSEGVVEGNESVIGEVKDKIAIIIDDIISSGKTIKLAVDALDRAGAKKIFACATHGLFVGSASEILNHPKLDKVLITDSIPPFRLKKEILKEKILLFDTSVLFAKAIKRAQGGDSLVDLIKTYPYITQESFLQS